MLLRTFQAIYYGFIFFNVHIHPATFALLFFGNERVCVWCAAKYFLCHLSLNKCIYGTHPTFYRLVYRCYELIITNIKRNGEWIWWHIPNLCGTDIEWQKRHICVHETYGWTEKKSSLMTYAPPVPMIRSLSLRSLSGCRCVCTITKSFGFCQQTNAFFFSSFVWEWVREFARVVARILSQFKQMDTRYDMDSWFSCCNWDKCTNGQMFVAIWKRIDA